MKKIAIVTRDCAGVNAAIRSVVRTALGYGTEVVGAMKGYEGLIDGVFISLNSRSVSGIINTGGTILKTSRSARFRTQEGRRAAAETMRNQGIEGLIVIGGNGTLTGAHLLAQEQGVKIVGIPATIDNDVAGIHMTIGADTAVNVALDALDKIRDTATSLERIFVVEVMGRDCGYIALEVALAGGCEQVLIPEKDFSLPAMCDEIKTGNAKGKVSWMIIVAEGAARAQNVAEQITRITGLETRIAVLGHIQRGGRPTATDRILAARLGHQAFLTLHEGGSDVCVGIHSGQPVTVALQEAVKPKKIEIEDYYTLIKILT